MQARRLRRKGKVPIVQRTDFATPFYDLYRPLAAYFRPGRSGGIGWIGLRRRTDRSRRRGSDTLPRIARFMTSNYSALPAGVRLNWCVAAFSTTSPGNTCEGYALQFRQVSELNSGEGKVTLSDLRTTTWEDGDAKSYRFASENFLDNKSADVVDGSAERKNSGIAVKLTKPQQKSLELDPAMTFPAEHMRRIISAAMEGKSIVEVPVYDGSETGEKAYNTLTVIGREIPPGEKLPTDASTKMPNLANLKRWPVTISYFDRNSKGGEQTPALRHRV